MKENNNGKGLCIASLVLGILSIVGSFIPVVCYFTLLFSILAIVFAVNGKKKAIAEGNPSGMATAGLVLGIISLGFAIAGLICAVACVGALASAGAAGAAGAILL